MFTVVYLEQDLWRVERRRWGVTCCCDVCRFIVLRRSELSGVGNDILLARHDVLNDLDYMENDTVGVYSMYLTRDAVMFTPTM